MNKPVVKPNNSENLPGYQAKINILKQIDDAASQMGTASRTGAVPHQIAGNRSKLSELNSLRKADAKRAAMMVLSGNNNAGLNQKDLESLNASNLGGNYVHNKTLLGAKHNDEKSKYTEDLRSLRSEYDYGSKKKFVDVIGNIKKKHNYSGLDGLKDHPGFKNLDTMSNKSGRYSTMSNFYKRKYNNLKKDDQDMDAINELDQEYQNVDEIIGKTIYD